MLGSYALYFISVIFSSIQFNFDVESRGSTVEFLTLIGLKSNASTSASTGVRIVSLLLSTLAVSVVSSATAFFEVQLISCSYFVKNGLKVLSLKNGCGVEEDTKTEELFRLNLKLFEELNYFVNQFNNIFGYIMMLWKCLILLNLCFFVYCVIFAPDRSAIVLFSVVAIDQPLNSAVMLPIASTVIQECLNFQVSWSKSASLTHLQKYQVDFIEPFGIKSAHLYTVLPTTVLSFWSIMITNIIIVLQIYYVKK